MAINLSQPINIILSGLDARIAALETPLSGVLVQVGNSIAAGYQADHPYISQLGFGSGVTINNGYAQTGHRVSDLPNDVPNGLASFYTSAKTCVAIFERGTNDIRVDGKTGAQLYDLVKGYITAYKNQGFYVALTTLLPFTDMTDATTQAEVKNYNTLVRANTAGADAVLDFAADPVMGAATAPNDTTLYVDKLHPTTAGQDRLAVVAKPVVSSLLRKPVRAPAGSTGGGTTPLNLSGAAFSTSAAGFGQELTGGYATTPPGNNGAASAGGTPSGSTWTEEIFVTFPSSNPSSVQVPVMQGGRFIIAQSTDGKLQVQLNDDAGNGSFFGGGGFSGGGSVPAYTGRHHIRISVKPGAQTLEVDGASVATLAMANPATTNDTYGRSLRALTNNGQAGQFPFGGNVDENAVFSTYRAGLPVPTAPYNRSAPGIVELWHLDGDGSSAAA